MQHKLDYDCDWALFATRRFRKKVLLMSSEYPPVLLPALLPKHFGVANCMRFPVSVLQVKHYNHYKIHSDILSEIRPALDFLADILTYKMIVSDIRLKV